MEGRGGRRRSCVRPFVAVRPVEVVWKDREAGRVKGKQRTTQTRHKARETRSG